MISVAASAAMPGCSAHAPRSGGAAPAVASTTSYDGRYEGTIRVTGVAGSMDPRKCATEPRMVLDVRDSTFQYALPHPHAAASSPELAKRTTPTYTGRIAPSGAISGFSNDTNTTMIGQVRGSRM